MKKILKDKRLDLILELFNSNEYLTYDEISNKLNISLSTVRRDVDDLFQMKLVNKISGGVELLKSEKDLTISIRSKRNILSKKSIAKKAIKLIKDNDFIFIDAGTTTFELVKLLKNIKVTVVTNGINHVEKLLENNIKTIILCGNVKKSTKAIVGNLAINQINKFYFDKCFIGSNAYDEERGYSTPSIEEATLKELIIKNSKEKYILMDSSKINKSSNIYFANSDDIKLITEEK